MANDVKWIIYSSGQYMLVRFNVGNEGHSSTGFLAKIHYGKDIQKNTEGFGRIKVPSMSFPDLGSLPRIHP